MANARTIWVEAGERLAPGQIALLEDHPDHPTNAMGEAQAFIVKDDPVFHRGQVALTAKVSERLGARALREVAEPGTGKAARGS